MTRKVERYAIHLADLDPTRGGEIAKTRPVVVVSQESMNRHLDTVVVCPLPGQHLEDVAAILQMSGAFS